MSEAYEEADRLLAQAKDDNARHPIGLSRHIRRLIAGVFSRQWIRLRATSPSGKTLYCCTSCGRVSPTPDKTCEVIGDPSEKWKCSNRFGDDDQG